MTPLPFIGLPPHVVMRSNLKHFLERIQSGWEESLEGAHRCAARTVMASPSARASPLPDAPRTHRA